MNTALLLQVGSDGSPGSYTPDVAQWWGWVGAACFLVGVAGFSLMGLRATPKGGGHFAAKILVVLTAMTSYIALAFAQGSDRLGEGTYFSYARFVDWEITTPLLLLGLALLAVPRARDALPLVLSIMAVDLYMIVTGLFAGLSDEGRGVWSVWFILSSLAFVVLYALFFGPLAQKAREKVRGGGAMQRSDDKAERYLGALHSGQGRWSVPMSALLALIWLIYPVNFFGRTGDRRLHAPYQRRRLHDRRRDGEGRLRFYPPGRRPRRREARGAGDGPLPAGDGRGGARPLRGRTHPPRGRLGPPQAPARRGPRRASPRGRYRGRVAGRRAEPRDPARARGRGGRRFGARASRTA